MSWQIEKNKSTISKPRFTHISNNHALSLKTDSLIPLTSGNAAAIQMMKPYTKPNYTGIPNQFGCVIQCMRLRGSMTTDQRGATETGNDTDLMIPEGAEVIIDTQTIPNKQHIIKLGEADVDVYVNAGTVMIPYDYRRSLLVSNDGTIVNGNQLDEGIAESAQTGIERGTKDKFLQQLGNTFELFAEPYIRAIHSDCSVFSNVKTASTNELDFVVVDYKLNRIIIYSAKLSQKAFKSARDQEMWGQMNAAFFKEQALNQADYENVGGHNYFTNPLIYLISPETFHMTRESFADKVSPGWKTLA